MENTYQAWNKFKAKDIPSSLSLFDDIYDFIKKNDQIIDFGCGFGKTVFELFSKGYTNISGIDINKDGIEYATKLSNKITEEKPNFMVDDLINLNLSENSYNFGIMQAVLTTITEQKQRESIIKNISRTLKKDSYLYMAEFGLTWHSALYRKRYLDGIEMGKEEGMIASYNKQTGELEYFAKHYREKEIVELLIHNGFSIENFRYEVFTTRSGRKINGMVVIAKNTK